MAIVKFNTFVNGVWFLYMLRDCRMVIYKYLKPKYEVQEIGSKPIDTKEHFTKEN